MPSPTTADRPAPRRGFTLLEVMVVLTVMGVLIAIPSPFFLRAVEQSKLDVAAANLRAIWSAQRLYYLQNNQYGTLNNLSTVPAAVDDLLDGSILAGNTFYGYTVVVSPDGQSFTATATHPIGSQCSGSLGIDQTGNLVCSVTFASRSVVSPMTPSLEPQS